MREFVRQFVSAAADTLDLDGPVALLASDTAGGAGDWMRRQFGNQLTIDCRIPANSKEVEEVALGSLPFEEESVRALFCLDLLRRFDESAELLRMSRPLLAPGGLLLFTAHIGDARPQPGVSRVLTPLGLERLAADLDAAILGWQGDADFPDSLFLVACRAPVPTSFAQAAGRFVEAFQTTKIVAPEPATWPVKLWRLWQAWRHGPVVSAPETSAAATSFLLHLPSQSNWKEALLNWPPAKEMPEPGLDLC